jgi:5-methylcytosine-specific restriction endonuclease McrA
MPYKDKKIANEYARKYQNARHQRLRNEALNMLGGKCAVCDIADDRVLQIDHIKPIRRRTNGESSSWRTVSKIHQGLEDINNLQILCANCHMIKSVSELRAHDYVPSASG